VCLCLKEVIMERLNQLSKDLWGDNAETTLWYTRMSSSKARLMMKQDKATLPSFSVLFIRGLYGVLIASRVSI
jgi:hypothetical protein